MEYVCPSEVLRRRVRTKKYLTNFYDFAKLVVHHSSQYESECMLAAQRRYFCDVLIIGGGMAGLHAAHHLIGAGVDTAIYKNVMIWCVPFRVLFSYAELKEI